MQKFDDCPYRYVRKVEQANHLETATVCQRSAFPIHESRKPSELSQQVRAWPIPKVVCVSQDYLTL